MEDAKENKRHTPITEKSEIVQNCTKKVCLFCGLSPSASISKDFRSGNLNH